MVIHCTSNRIHCLLSKSHAALTNDTSTGADPAQEAPLSCPPSALPIPPPYLALQKPVSPLHCSSLGQALSSHTKFYCSLNQAMPLQLHPPYLRCPLCLLVYFPMHWLFLSSHFSWNFGFCKITILHIVGICPCGYPRIYQIFIVTVFAWLPLSVASETCWCYFCLCQFPFPHTHSKLVPLNQKKGSFLCSIFNLFLLHTSSMVKVHSWFLEDGNNGFPYNPSAQMRTRRRGASFAAPSVTPICPTSGAMHPFFVSTITMYTANIEIMWFPFLCVVWFAHELRHTGTHDFCLFVFKHSLWTISKQVFHLCILCASQLNDIKMYVHCFNILTLFSALQSYDMDTYLFGI